MHYLWCPGSFSPPGKTLRLAQTLPLCLCRVVVLVLAVSENLETVKVFASLHGEFAKHVPTNYTVVDNGQWTMVNVSIHPELYLEVPLHT